MRVSCGAAYNRGVRRPRTLLLLSLPLLLLLACDPSSPPVDADDLIQQAFLDYARIAEPETIQSPKSYLKKMIFNLVYLHRKQQKKLQGHIDILIAEQTWFQHDPITPERQLETKETLHRVRLAVANMPEKRRSMLLLNRIHGQAYAEIARNFGVSPTSVKKHVARAVYDLHQALKPETPAEQEDER